eukprot:6180874-Pleurochrysis_carterae.AAC.1
MTTSRLREVRQTRRKCWHFCQLYIYTRLVASNISPVATATAKIKKLRFGAGAHHHPQALTRVQIKPEIVRSTHLYCRPCCSFPDCSRTQQSIPPRRPRHNGKSCGKKYTATVPSLRREDFSWCRTANSML